MEKLTAIVHNRDGVENSKSTIEFAEKVARLELIDFLGLCKILCVPTIKLDRNKGDEEILRPFEDVFSDVIDKFITLSRTRRKEILKVVRFCVK